MRVVALVFTGGTISMRFDAAIGGAVPALAADEIVAAARGIEHVATLRVEEWGRYPGPHMTMERMWSLRERLHALVADPAIDGVVVTHGTDTIEESAYLATRSIAPVNTIGLSASCRGTVRPTCRIRCAWRRRTTRVDTGRSSCSTVASFPRST